MNAFRADVKATLRSNNDVKKTPTSPSSTKLYRVQIGAYSIKANADKQLAKAQKAGFTDAFIKYD